jgi:hypothetical protein
MQDSDGSPTQRWLRDIESSAMICRGWALEKEGRFTVIRRETVANTIKLNEYLVIRMWVMTPQTLKRNGIVSPNIGILIDTALQDSPDVQDFSRDKRNNAQTQHPRCVEIAAITENDDEIIIRQAGVVDTEGAQLQSYISVDDEGNFQLVVKDGSGQKRIIPCQGLIMRELEYKSSNTIPLPTSPTA